MKSLKIETPREFFEKVLPSKFDPNKSAGVEAVIQMNITGPRGGDWVVTIKDQKIDVKESTVASPSIAIKIADADFVDVINGKTSAISAFLAGKIQFKGNLTLGMKLMDMGVL